MESKHTPGPWIAKLYYVNGSHPHYVFADDAPLGARLPAVVDTEANARLIEAAPDLLAQRDALLAACKALRAIIHDDLTHASQRVHHKAISSADAAIANAEGGAA